MSDGKVPSLVFTTPNGVARWPFIDTPALNFNEDGQEYRVTLQVPAADAQHLIEKLEVIEEENLKYQKSQVPPKEQKKVTASKFRPWEEETDDDGNPTGFYLFKFKLPAQVTRKSDNKTFEMSPKIFDGFGKPCPGVAIGGGSVLKVNAEARGYYVASSGAGVKLALRAVQILDLKLRGDRDAKSFGFEPQDNGFTFEGAAPADPASPAPAGNGDF